MKAYGHRVAPAPGPQISMNGARPVVIAAIKSTEAFWIELKRAGLIECFDSGRESLKRFGQLAADFRDSFGQDDGGVQIRKKIARDSLTHADAKPALFCKHVEVGDAAARAFVIDDGNRRSAPVWLFAQ